MEFTLIIEICKVLTLRLKVLNKHNMTHNIDQGGKCYEQFNKKLANTWCRHQQWFKHNYVKDACMHAHTHAHTVQTERDEGQWCLTEISCEEFTSFYLPSLLINFFSFSVFSSLDLFPALGVVNCNKLVQGRGFHLIPSWEGHIMLPIFCKATHCCVSVNRIKRIARIAARV